MSPETSHYLEPRNVNLLGNKVFADVIKDQDEATLGTSWRSQLVKAPSFHCRRGTGSIPGQGTKIPHAVQGPSTVRAALRKRRGHGTQVHVMTGAEQRDGSHKPRSTPGPQS